MPDDQQQPGTPRKKGKIPTWGWVALGVGAVVLYYFYAKRQQAAAASSGTGAAGATAPVASGSYGNAGDLAALAPYLQNLSGNASTASGTTPFNPPKGEQLMGGGYGQSGAAATGPITSPSGAQFIQVPAGAATGGVQYYYQPEPGIFTPINPAGSPGLLGGPPPGGPATPWYQAIGTSA